MVKKKDSNKDLQPEPIKPQPTAPVAVQSVKETTPEDNAATIIQRAYRFRNLRKKIAKMAVKRKRIVEEIISTEESYVNDLKTVETTFQGPLAQKKLIPTKLMPLIFGNINAIAKLNATFLERVKSAHAPPPALTVELLKRRESRDHDVATNSPSSPVVTPSTSSPSTLSPPLKDPKKKGGTWKGITNALDLTLRRGSTTSATPTPTTLEKTFSDDTTPKPAPKQRETFGGALKSIIPFMKLYTDYINNYQKAMDTLRECRKTNPELDKFLKKLKVEAKECRSMDISSFLVMPVQRIPRYQLLLQEVLKNTPRGHHDFADLENSLKIVVNVANHLNNQRKYKEAQTRVVSVTRRLEDTLNNTKLREQLDEEVVSLMEHAKATVVAPHRHYVDECKVKFGRIEKEGEDQKVHTLTYDMILFIDLLLFFIDETEQIPVGTEDPTIIALPLFLVLSDISHANLTDNRLQINYFVGPHNFVVEFINEDDATRFIDLMLQHKTQEEDKLAKLLTDKQSLNNHHEESQALESAMEMLKRLEADAQKMETVQQNFPKKQEDFIKLYETLKDYATRWRELNVREQMLESGEQNQKEFANIESDRKELVSLIEECIERITKGYEVLQRYQENFDDVNDVLLCVLRGDKQSMTKLFGQPPKSIKEMGLDDLWIEIQAINSEVKRGFTKIPILIDTIPQIATNQFVSPRSPRLATPTTPRSENFDEERKELQKKIDSLEQELNKKKIMFDSVTRDRKKLENEVKLLSEQNLKLRKLAEGETSPSPRSNSLTKHSPRPTNSPKGKETEEMKILRVTVQQLSQKNERLQKELEASKERDEQDKLQLSKNQSIVDSLNNQIKKLMENTSKEVQITLEQNGVEKEKVSKLEAEVESLQKTVQGLTEKLKESAPVQSTGKKDLDTMLLQEMTKEMDQMKQKYETEIANLKSILERPKQKPVVPSLTLNTSDSDISHQPFAARMELFKGLDQTPKGNDSSRVKAMKSGRKTDEKLREEVQELRKIVERYKSESKLKQ